MSTEEVKKVETTEQAQQPQEVKKAEKPKKAPQPKKEKKPAQGKKTPKNKTTADLLGIEAKKSENFPDWYTQVITRSDMLDYYDVSGCYILRPWAYRQWELIQSFLDEEIKKRGVMNTYFPIFVNRSALKKEEDAFEGFGAEVAWVTHSGKSALAEPIAVRPTSETVMYPAMKNWIKSHRDLPLRVNQWCNVVRWEFKHPVPFIRTREFLWQEGHDVFATREEAEREVRDILELYARVYEELLAVPVLRGVKSEREKFAGALFTTTVEAYIPANGRAVQAATSHCLGQCFAKVFGLEVENEKHEKQYVWQNSWGLTTRSIGVCIMVHGDDKGLVLPPRVAPVQVVVIPLRFRGSEEAVEARADELANAIRGTGLRVAVDKSDNTGGWKFNHWEVRGVPIRVEVGPKDLEKGTAVVCRRDTGAKEFVGWCDLAPRVKALTEEIQNALFQKAKAERDSHIVRVTEWKDFVPALNAKEICLCSWCGETACEEDVKARSAKESLELSAAAAAAAEEEEAKTGLTGAAKTLCIPFEQPELPEGSKCFACGKPAKTWIYFGRSY